MMKDVLLKISEGKTIAEIAEELNMEYSAAIGIIEHLVKLGYLEERKRSDEESRICKSCPLYKVCSKKEFKIYYLTEKGRKLLRID